jgi:hypothetical protein
MVEMLFLERDEDSIADKLYATVSLIPAPDRSPVNIIASLRQKESQARGPDPPTADTKALAS